MLNNYPANQYIYQLIFNGTRYPTRIDARTFAFVWLTAMALNYIDK